MIIYTIGHSTRTSEAFIDLLLSYGIEMVIDVRTIPKSRHYPQFNQDSLKALLKEKGIRYHHLTQLGGLRHTTKNSIQTGWRNASFRGFADYMLTPAYKEGIEELEKLGREHKAAILCAEAVPWRCHRSLIADTLTVYQWKVYHITSKKTANLHKLTPFLQIKKGQFIYEAMKK